MTLSFLPGQIVQVLNLNLEECLPKLYETYKKVVTFSKLSDLYQGNVFSDDGNLVFVIHNVDVPLSWERYSNNVTLLWDVKLIDCKLPVINEGKLRFNQDKEYQRLLEDLIKGIYSDVSIDTIIQFFERVIVSVGLIVKKILNKDRLFFMDPKEFKLTQVALSSREMSIASLMMIMGEVDIIEVRTWLNKLINLVS